jgi:hypothetical protein
VATLDEAAAYGLGMTTLRPAWYAHGPGQRWWDGSGWTEHFVPSVPAAATSDVAVVGPAGERGYFDCGMGLRRWWDGQRWVGPAIAPSSVPWKSTVIAYVLLLLWGGLGVHRFYLRCFVTATVMAALWLVGGVFTTMGALLRTQAAVTALGGATTGGAASAITPTGILTVGGALAYVALIVWLLIDVLSLPSLVRSLNQQRAAQAVGSAASAPARSEALVDR